ncbi:hypothetical protein CLIB1423_08S04500 [[Candida] railenensis]|uniref:PSP1 C-terminal domain-containing protein n=1 Tax=[Candida] railenensis TaxID=45579 RepID=A0A9P0QQA0_9ASCO|nr:hypothetical protein CLIB1423_08S04500 [[Candida] railenensis]
MSYNFPMVDSNSQFKDILFSQQNPQAPSKGNATGARTAGPAAFSPATQTNAESPRTGVEQSPHSGPTDPSYLGTPPPSGMQSLSRFQHPFGQENSFTLPSELQGGIGTISSRRPSYAAESFTRAIEDPSELPANLSIKQNTNVSGNNNVHLSKPKNLAAFAAMNSYNNFNLDSLNDSFGNFNLNANFNDFQARRPSQLADFQSNQFLPSYMYQPHPHQAGQAQPGVQSSTLQQHQQQQQQQQQNQQHQQQHQQQPQQQQSRQGQQPTASQQSQQQGPPLSQQPQIQSGNHIPSATNSGAYINPSIPVNLENGLILQDQYIIASPELKSLFMKAIKYFQSPAQTNQILKDLYMLLQQPTIIKLITFIKNLNNLTFNHKTLCLVINKNGKFDLLSYPNNSNIFLQTSDLVIVDGDRGKDLVMILEPLIDLNTAILFNFLKKLEHLKSLTVMDGPANGNTNNSGGNKGKKISGGTHSTMLNASQIINTNSNEDNEFIITLPTKQVLRFATPKEVHKLSGKFLEEKKAFVTCLNKIKELNLQRDLELINVEYQSDFKKLIFYYFAGFKRIDFRGLIKELFKIYKTRIWLCAVLPFDKPELYITQESPPASNDNKVIITERTPSEYELSNDQILKFSINEIQNLSTPNYFHSSNLQNLIVHLQNEIKGKFYGFNNSNPVPSSPSTVLTFVPKQNQNQSQNQNQNPNASPNASAIPKQNPNQNQKQNQNPNMQPEPSQQQNQHSQQNQKLSPFPLAQGTGELGKDAPKNNSGRSGSISYPQSSKILPNFNPFGDNV